MKLCHLTDSRRPDRDSSPACAISAAAVAGRVKLLTGIEGASSRAARWIVLIDGLTVPRLRDGGWHWRLGQGEWSDEGMHADALKAARAAVDALQPPATSKDRA